MKRMESDPDYLSRVPEHIMAQVKTELAVEWNWDLTEGEDEYDRKGFLLNIMHLGQEWEHWFWVFPTYDEIKNVIKEAQADERG